MRTLSDGQPDEPKLDGPTCDDESSVQSAVIVQLIKQFVDASESSYKLSQELTRNYASRQYWLGTARGFTEAAGLLEELLDDAAPSRIEGDHAAD